MISAFNLFRSDWNNVSLLPGSVALDCGALVPSFCFNWLFFSEWCKYKSIRKLLEIGCPGFLQTSGCMLSVVESSFASTPVSRDSTLEADTFACSPLTGLSALKAEKFLLHWLSHRQVRSDIAVTIWPVNRSCMMGRRLHCRLCSRHITAN